MPGGFYFLVERIGRLQLLHCQQTCVERFARIELDVVPAKTRVVEFTVDKARIFVGFNVA